MEAMQDGDETTMENVDDLRVRGIRALVPAACLIEDVNGDQAVLESVALSRREIARAVRGEDSRILVVSGPVSMHDPVATMEYARKLSVYQKKMKDELIVVMRVFLDEPTGGAGYWSGAMYDPDLDGSFQINKGFRQARQLLLDIARLGLPIGCLYCDPMSPQFIGDLVSWTGISSYSATSQLYRELASGLSTPVGFGCIGKGAIAAGLAVDAVKVAGTPHAFLSVSKQGVAGIVETSGNRDCHVVLFPGEDGIEAACDALSKSGRPARVMVECPDAAAANTIATKTVPKKDRQVMGVLLPSFLKGGSQVLKPNDPSREYGLSVTEPCMDWEATAEVLAGLAAGVKKRRDASAPSPKRTNSIGEMAANFVEMGKIEATDNLRVNRIRPLLAAAVCIEETEADTAIKQQVFEARCEVSALLHGESDRLLVVVGPSSIHDEQACMEYAARLKALSAQLSDELLIIMNVNFESVVAPGGWKGMINDPNLDGSYQINKGFRKARQLLLDINRLGLPTGSEYLDTITPQYLADLVSWAVVGERTCASRAHRELASGLSTPVGFVKDSVRDAIRGGERVALDAARASGAPHAFLSVSKQGVAGIVETTGNSDCHVVLPSEKLDTLSGECTALSALKLPARVMVKCATPDGAAYSQADHLKAVSDVAAKVSAGSDEVFGVLIPSFLLSGRQDMQLKHTGPVGGNGKAKKTLLHGMSVTEPCMDWSSTAQALEGLAEAVRKRRAGGSAKKQKTSS